MTLVQARALALVQALALALGRALAGSGSGRLLLWLRVLARVQALALALGQDRVLAGSELSTARAQEVLAPGTRETHQNERDENVML